MAKESAKVYNRAVWWNSEASFEVRAISGLDFRLFAGYAVLVARTVTTLFAGITAGAL